MTVLELSQCSCDLQVIGKQSEIAEDAHVRCWIVLFSTRAINQCDRVAVTHTSPVSTLGFDETMEKQRSVDYKAAGEPICKSTLNMGRRGMWRYGMFTPTHHIGADWSSSILHDTLGHKWWFYTTDAIHIQRMTTVTFPQSGIWVCFHRHANKAPPGVSVSRS